MKKVTDMGSDFLSETTYTTIEMVRPNSAPMDFKEYKVSLKKNVDKMLTGENNMFITDINKDEFWDTYLNAFPEELRQDNNCSACRSYIKQFGAMVAIKNNKVVTMWDFDVRAPYDVINKTLHDYVSSRPIVNVYFNNEKSVGVDSNRETLADGTIRKWEHMHYVLPNFLWVDKRNQSVESKQGELRSLRDVFKRSLEELTIDSVDSVLELISSNSLYRGQEFKFAVSEFRKKLIEYQNIPALDKDAYVWKSSLSVNHAVARIRNTAIGTLLIDLSEGMDLELAVSKFERNVMAPSNYKRPTALITQSMIKDAQLKIKELGLEDSLARKFATKDDIRVDNILFINRDIVKSNDIFETLKDSTTVNPKTLSKTTEISIEKFITDVLPLAEEIEILVENNHESNLMSLIAPENVHSPSLFNWNNGFSWSYNNALADSMKEKVKSAGGNVEGFIRCSLEWFNYDDLDLHLKMPNGEHVYYSQKRSKCGIALDVDMNAGSGGSRTPVENIIFPFSAKESLPEGIYKLIVVQFSKRENIDSGYNVEIEHDGFLYNFAKEKSPSGEDLVATFEYTKKNGFIMLSEGENKVNSKQIWNINTNTFHKVNMIMNSPNHWDGELGTGNKHYFFMIDGLKNEGLVRGIFNEFLKPEFQQHKRVFEAIGSKMSVTKSDKELSGVGFSSTLKGSLICRVKGKVTRTLKINF
jgi:hypothetical protein